MVNHIARSVLLAALCLMAGGAAIAQTPASAPTAKAALSVDASKHIGILKPLRGVHGAPQMGFLDDAQRARGRPRPADLTAAYKEAKITHIRTHDSLGAGDIDPTSGPLAPLKGPALGGGALDGLVIFPDLSADPSDPKSYNFSPTDALIAGIYAVGAEPIFRLGRGGGTTATPPEDLVKYGEIIRHIVLHYNKGWADGYHWGIRYWEVWNEPDLGEIWWRGTPEEFYALYATAAMAVKAADDTAWVGGPAIAMVNEPTPYREGFLDYVRDENLPLDFFAWHYYSVDSNDPQDFVRIGVEMQRLLDARGFTRTLNVLDEWNYGIMDAEPPTSAHRAAFIASSAIYMQDSPIDLAALYRADRSFGADGVSPEKTGQALIALGRLSDTPVRLRTSGGDKNGLAVLAGRSSDNRTVQVLISNYQIKDEDLGPREGPDAMPLPGGARLVLLPRRSDVTYGGNAGYQLTVTGLAQGERYDVERYRISDARDWSLFDRSDGLGPAIVIDGDLGPPGIDLIVLRRRP